MYYIYHIPKKKIGVTSNPKIRVEKIQGYKPREYEILLETEDIDEVSKKEIELQKQYGYKIDTRLYKNLKFNKKMKINITEQTTTFPLPINKLKGRLMDHIGLQWKHPQFGTFKLTNENIPWIEKNALSSQYSKDRCYIYNKAFYEAFLDKSSDKKNNKTPNRDIFPLIRDWARERGIFDKGNSHTQYVKLMEESGELAQSLLKKDEEGIKDAIGDMIVVLTNLAELEGMYIEDCIQFAYNEIKDRKGKMSNGTFVKKL